MINNTDRLHCVTIERTLKPSLPDMSACCQGAVVPSKIQLPKQIKFNADIHQIAKRSIFNQSAYSGKRFLRVSNQKVDGIYNYSYLIGTLSVGVFWLHFFFVRPDLRSPMLLLSFLFGVGGVLSEFIYASDWWSPSTLTGTKVGVEDFLFGFFFSGAVAMGYEVILKKSHETCGQYKKHFRFRYMALMISAIFFGSALIFQVHSFTATVLAFGACTTLMLLLRKDLITNAAYSSLFACMLAFVFFGIPELLTSGWVASAWSFDKLSGAFVFFIPLEDFVWFVMAGAFIGPLFKYWKNYRFTV